MTFRTLYLLEFLSILLRFTQSNLPMSLSEVKTHRHLTGFSNSIFFFHFRPVRVSRGNYLFVQGS